MQVIVLVLYSGFSMTPLFHVVILQDDVFTEVGKPLVEHAVQGYNACCFAYGQTGSGKTYSMFGKETGEHDLRGMIPRAAEELFKVRDPQRSDLGQHGSGLGQCYS
jgi:kinesin family protein 7